MFVLHRKHLWVATACYGDSFTFLHADIRTSQETPVGLHGLLGDSITFLYVDVRTSQETPVGLHGLLGDSFTFLYVDDVRNS
jgi:hypothetical protein